MAEIAAVATSTYTSGFENSLKPSVDEMIGLFSPSDTPFMANMSVEKAEQRKEQWMEDELDPAGENAHLEGAEVSATERRPPAFGDNWTQIFLKDYSVTGTAEVVKKYGRKSELNRIKGLKLKELACDIEWNLLNSVGNAGTKGTPRKMNGAFQFVDTVKGKDDGRYFTFGDTPAAANHITEKILLDVMQGIYENGVDADTVLCPMTQKRKISSFTDKGRLTINQNADAKKVTMSVRVIETDMGTVTVMAERHINPTRADSKDYDKVLVYRKDIFSRMVLRSIKSEPLAKTGDSEKFMIVTEQTLKCKTRKGLGSISNLTREPLVTP